MDARHLKRPPLGELPAKAYPQRTPFPIMTAEQAEAEEAQEAEDRRVIKTVRRAKMVNYPFTIVAGTQAAIKALSENLRRAYLFVQVKAGSSAGILYVNYGYPADTGHVEITSANGSYEWPCVPVESIWLTASTGTMTVVVTEGTEI